MVPALPNPEDFSVAVCVASWNEDITNPLLEGALGAFRLRGVSEDHIHVVRVPGSVELVNAAAWSIGRYKPSAVVVLGCVIRGETPHFDYVCQSVTQGVTALNADCDTPVIFGVLTVENQQQAVDRIKGGSVGDKGAEAAEAALKMIDFRRQVQEL